MQISELPVHHKLIKRLTDKGYETLTEIQQATILPAIKGNDVIASSKTGSGKTLAFLIPAINRLMNTKPLSRRDPRLLILAPTRELAKQVYVEARSLIQNTGLQAQLIVGGENYNDQVKALRRNPQILVGTAGRVCDHLEDKTFFLNGLEMLVFDEADRMLDLGFSHQLKRINQFADHRKRQTMLFSATLDGIEIDHMASQLLRAPTRIAIGESKAQHQDIHEALYFADHIEHKEALLKAVLTETKYNQAIVFTATRDDALRLASLLNANGFDAIGLRGDLPQNERAAIMNAFDRGQHTILVTTDVASRGLDLLKVGLVVNVDLPKHSDEYIHRIGRTGRAGQQGVAVSFVGPRDWKSFTALTQHLHYPLNCQSHPTLPAEFSGLKPRKPRKVTKQTKGNKTKSAVKNTRSTTKKRVDTMGGNDVGMAPIKRKPRAQLPDDEEE